MSNPTSNFGWQMPEPTDLVTDLPADFEVFGQAVDTDFADLNGGTTGQLLSKTSATDLDFTWVTPNAGDITGVTAGTGISGGGTSGDVTVTNSMATAFTNSGDLIQATGSGTFARLGTGTNGQYLTTNGTTNSWGSISAGGMTVLASGSITNTTLSITSIDQTYTNLFLYLNMTSGGAGAYGVDIRLNANSNSIYSNCRLALVNGSAPVAASSLESAFRVQSDFFAAASSFQLTMNIYQYTNTDPRKIVDYNSIGLDQSYSAPLVTNATGQFANTSAITSIQTVGSLTGSYILYGVK